MSGDRFDETAIRNHFWMLHHLAKRAGIPGKLVLSAIADKATGLPIVNQHFAIGDADAMVAAAMAFESKPYGLYAPYCIMRHDLPPDSKGSQDDVVATLAFPVDADSDHPGKATPRAPVTPNYVVESSAGNLQEILVLHQPLMPAESRPLARALKEKTGDKNCVGDIARVMRVPGTVNWPSAAKINRGRSPEPQPVRVIQPWNSWTSIDDLRAAVAFVQAAPPLVPSDTPPALDGYRLEEVSWWVERKKAKGDLAWDQLDWAMFGGALKLHFGDNGLDLFQRISEDPDTAKERFDKFPFDYSEGNRTLHWYLDRDIDWMFRHYLDCPKPPPGPVVAIPQEILDRLNAERERYLVAQMGPLPDHPELTAQQADTLVQFWAHLPSGKIIHEPSRGLWAAGSFDKHAGRIKNPMSTGPGTLASTWLSQHQAVQSMGWDPAAPMIIEDRILADDWVRAPGCRTFNIYLPSAIIPACGDVSIWLNHIKAIYPNEADHIVLWFAHRVQRPGEKVNHGLVFVGDPGIGKDTLIEPVVAAVGPHNFKSVSAARFFNSEFNGYLKSVMLRIDEIHDLGGESKYAFHDRTKPVLAAPPASHEINEKHIPHHSARNVCGVILTSNHADALYLDRNDRRHFVCVSDRRKEDFPGGYFDDLYAWFADGGNEAVAHYLANLNLSAFNAKAPPPKTAGWHAIVAAGMAPESGDMADVIEALGRPAVVTLSMIRQRTPPESVLRIAFEDAKQRKNIPKRLKECGYIEVNNPYAKDGRWPTIAGKVKIYGRQDFIERERLNAARQFAGALPPAPC
ncbi:MAG: DUF5906 domain-containing protein [Xanthobacteraceae bacterium]